MRIVDPGHGYELLVLDARYPDVHYYLPFVKREGEKYPGNVGTQGGTTLQEVFRACLDRLQYLDKQEQHPFNTVIMHGLKMFIWLLEVRAAKRHNRPTPDSLDEAVYGLLCEKCGHVGCKGECHA